MKLNLKSIAVTLGLAAGLALGGTTFTEVATPEKADAVTLSNCKYTYYKHPGGSYAYTTYRTCYYTYSFYERNTYPFPRNGTYSVVVPMYT